MSNRKDTQTLLDEYYKTRPESTVIKIRGQIDRPELYAYERKIGKQLVDMDAIEIAKMVISFAEKKNNSYKLSYRSYDTRMCILRDFFYWYIENYEVIKNPCNDKRIKGRSAIELLSENKSSAFTIESMNDAIKQIRDSQIEEYADYLECIMLLFYCGFPDAIDIVNCKDSDINHETKKVMVRGREVQLSDRCYELLVKVHNMEDYPAYRGNFVMVSCNESYFKFPTRSKYVGEANDRPPEYWAAYINRVFNREITNKLSLNINARTLYLLGFYDYIVERVGKEEANRLIMSYRNSEDTKTIMELANDYGVVEQNVTILRRLLTPFVEE